MPRRPAPTDRVVVAAPDKFRGTATAAEVCDAVARAAVRAGWKCIVHPMADGGEGTLAVFGGPNRTTVVSGPLGDPVEAGWRLSGKTAVIEMATASGIALVGDPKDNDPMAASTYGTGELIAAAVEAGAKRVIVGVGGSATTDGGLGAIRALNLARLSGVEILVASDVRIGFVEAAAVFGPQKGASTAEVALLERRLVRLAQVYAEEHGIDVTTIVGAGAAGGLAGGLASIGAKVMSGFELIADERHLLEDMETAGLVVTGEGFVDAESFDGKVVGSVVDAAHELGVACFVVAGEIFDDISSSPEGAPVDAVSLTERFGNERAMSETMACIEEVVFERLERA